MLLFLSLFLIFVSNSSGSVSFFKAFTRLHGVLYADAIARAFSIETPFNCNNCLMNKSETLSVFDFTDDLLKSRKFIRYTVSSVIIVFLMHCLNVLS